MNDSEASKSTLKSQKSLRKTNLLRNFCDCPIPKLLIIVDWLEEEIVIWCSTCGKIVKSENLSKLDALGLVSLGSSVLK